MSYLKRWLMWGVGGILLALHVTIAVAATCPALVTTALETLEDSCVNTGRNRLCYGHTELQMQAHPGVGAYTFAAPGDRVDVSSVQTLRMSGMDAALDIWGIGWMQVQANVENSQPEDVTLLLFGDVDMRNTVRPLVIGQPAFIHTTEGDDLNIRTGPGTNFPVLVALPDGTQVTILDGPRIINNLRWWQVRLNNGADGWAVESVDDDEERLPTLIRDRGVYYGPMQAIQVATGTNDRQCVDAPESGLLIQTPEGVTEVNFLINEVSINLRSTAYIQAVAGGDMLVNLLEGSADISVNGVSRFVPEGSRVRITMDLNLRPGTVSGVEAINPDDLIGLPVNQLPRPLTDIDTRTPEPITRLPNLVIENAVSFSVDERRAQVEVTVANRGDVRSGATTVSVTLAGSSIRSLANIRALEPGESQTVIVQLSGSPGTVNATVIADPDGFVIESSERDNVRNITVTFVIG